MWKHKFNNKSQKKDSSKRFHTDARILTSMEGKELAAAETERKVQKKNAETERAKKRKEMETADILRRAEQQRDNSTFSGTIQSKTKPHPIDLAVALGLEYEGASVDVLRVRINTHFNANLELKLNPRYIALFTRKRKHAGDENDDPRASLLSSIHPPCFPLWLWV
ncbi:hypothetical protein BDP27DRAFT_1422096 [Rhodocollybia butyracea]|uniref:Uncharacterized protein n=1 Tax=Rhodocollybia butyracea TaxID=206335 RepID=A0A9P5PRV6_9AGAR|nr:hypothetical protein BDP27DRAFT_1422096 [Rhodocollybia butyracea]